MSFALAVHVIRHEHQSRRLRKVAYEAVANMSAVNPAITRTITEEKIFEDRHETNFEAALTTLENDTFEEELSVGSPRGSIIDVEKASTLPRPTTPQDDPNIVFWDSPTDPQNPMNWSSFRKWGTIAVVSGITFLSPLGSSFIAPGVPEIMKEVSG